MRKNGCNRTSSCSRVLELEQRIRELEEKNTLLQHEIKERNVKDYGRNKSGASRDGEDEKPEPKKRGAPVGHRGWFRKKPVRIDEVEEVRLGQCPNCGNTHLTECGKVEVHVQEDIVIPRVKATKYLKHKYWCGQCKAVVRGNGREEMPNSYIGPFAKSVASFLKYAIKVSDRDIKRIFKALCGLTVVSSSIPGFNNQARRKGTPAYEALKKEIVKAPHIHADETGCPVDGKNWWDWIFATTNICLHVIRQSRGQKVVEEILGKKYAGILISDFLSAYNRLEANAKQRCLVHLLRDLKKILECYKPEDSGYVYAQRLKEILQKAMELSRKHRQNLVSSGQFEKEKEDLYGMLGDFQFPDPQDKPARRIAKRLARHKDEIFTFLNYPDVPCHNNFAEQLIRRSVLLRKITFGHRSENGVLNHSVLMSLLQTGQLNGKDEIPLIKEILLGKKNSSVQMCLGP
jgi:transposase